MILFSAKKIPDIPKNATGIRLRSQRCLGEVKPHNASPLFKNNEMLIFSNETTYNSISNLTNNVNETSSCDNVNTSLVVENEIEIAASNIHTQENDISIENTKTENSPTEEYFEDSDSNTSENLHVGLALKCVIPEENYSEKPRGLKLTLRVKRSSDFEEDVESSAKVINDFLLPEYEVLKNEGVEDILNSEYSQKKKRVKYKNGKTNEEEDITIDEKCVYQRPLKRLRIIFGNETHTINFPSPLTNRTT